MHAYFASDPCLFILQTLWCSISPIYFIKLFLFMTRSTQGDTGNTNTLKYPLTMVMGSHFQIVRASYVTKSHTLHKSTLLLLLKSGLFNKEFTIRHTADDITNPINYCYSAPATQGCHYICRTTGRCEPYLLWYVG